jgi:hypothetical protein
MTRKVDRYNTCGHLDLKGAATDKRHESFVNWLVQFDLGGSALQPAETTIDENDRNKISLWYLGTW